MSDADAFLAAIKAKPDDDGPRLVYADYLDERGDMLGEFIRAGVDGKGAPEPSEWLRDVYKRLAERGRQIWREYHPNDYGYLPPPHYVALALGWPPAYPAYHVNLSHVPTSQRSMSCLLLARRGFVSVAQMSWSDWLAGHGLILAKSPLECVELTTLPSVDEAMTLAVTTHDHPECRFVYLRLRLEVGDGLMQVRPHADQQDFDYHIPYPKTLFRTAIRVSDILRQQARFDLVSYERRRLVDYTLRDIRAHPAGYTDRHIITACLESRWPGLTWTLPDPDAWRDDPDNGFPIIRAIRNAGPILSYPSGFLHNPID